MDAGGWGTRLLARSSRITYDGLRAIADRTWRPGGSIRPWASAKRLLPPNSDVDFKNLYSPGMHANKRALPWRNTADPYRILVSEIMLQQTQVDRVIPKYEEFLQKYPTLEALANAPVDEVRQTWYPLGYNVRPLRLHSIAREAVEKYGGKIPDDPETLQSLKGIGRYTAGAVLSFAFWARGRDPRHQRPPGAASGLHRRGRCQTLQPPEGPLGTV